MVWSWETKVLGFGQKVADCRAHDSMGMMWREKMRLEGCNVRGGVGSRNLGWAL